MSGGYNTLDRTSMASPHVAGAAALHKQRSPAATPDPAATPADVTSSGFHHLPGILQFSAAAYSAGEGVGSATIAVTRTGGTAGAVGVSYATSDGTAALGSDYTAASGTLSWADGDGAAKTFTIPIADDALDEPDETVLLALNSPTGGATLGSQPAAALTIVDDDAPPAPPAPPPPPPPPPPPAPPAVPAPPAAQPPPSLTIEDLSVVEGNSGRPLAAFTVLLSAPSGTPVTVRFATANLTARAGQDYLARAGTLTIPPGRLFGAIVVPLLADTRVEPDKRFRVGLSNPVGATLARGAGVVTIVDDDGPTTRLLVGDARRAEGQAGRANLVFPVLLTRPSATAVTATVNTADDTARAGGDYVAVRRGRLTIAAGATRGTIVVPVVGDRAVEPHERVRLVVSSPSGAATADGLGVGTILNDD